MPDEDYVIEILVVEQVHDIGDVGIQIDVPAGEVHALAQAGQRDRIDVVTEGSQSAR